MVIARFERFGELTLALKGHLKFILAALKSKDKSYTLEPPSVKGVAESLSLFTKHRAQLRKGCELVVRGDIH